MPSYLFAILVCATCFVSVAPSEGPTVAGMVKLPDGTPAIGANVYLVERTPRGLTLPVKTINAVTNAQGHYEFQKVKLGSYLVWSEQAAFTSLEKKLRGERFVLTEEVNSATVDLNLKRGCTYRVHVKNAETKQPIPNASISFAWPDLDRHYHTDNDGFVEISGLAEYEWYFVVRADNYATLDRIIGLHPLGTEVNLNFDLVPSGTVEGRVVDESGNPIQDVNVHVRFPEPSMRAGIEHVKTDADGHFACRSIPVGLNLSLDFYKMGFQEWKQTIAVADRGDVLTVNANLNSVAQVKQSTIVEGCKIQVFDERRRKIENAKVVQRLNSSAGGNAEEYFTNANGVAQVEEIVIETDQPDSLDSVSFSVMAEGYVNQFVFLSLDKPEPFPTVTVQLERGITRRGRVYGPDGEPVSKVFVSTSNFYGETVHTDADGFFELKNCPASATISLQPSSKYSAKYNLRWNPQFEENEFQLAYEAVLRLTAVDDVTGVPIPDFNVQVADCTNLLPNEPRASVHPHNGSPGINVVSPATEFRLNRLVAGAPLKIVVTAEGYEPFCVERYLATVEPDAKILELRLTKEFR